MGGPDGDSQTQTSLTQIDPMFSPFFQQLAQGAQQASGQIPSTPFQGQFTAPGNQFLQSGATGLGNVSAGLAQQNLGQGAINLGQQTLQGQFLQNPFLSDAILAATQPSLEAAGGILGNIRGNAIGQGAFNSTRRDAQEAQLANNLQRNILQTGSQLGFQNFANERALQQQAPGLIAQGASLQQLPFQGLLQSGESLRALGQIPLTEQQLQFQEGLAAPFRPLVPFAQILSQIPVGSSTTVNTSIG